MEIIIQNFNNIIYVNLQDETKSIIYATQKKKYYLLFMVAPTKLEDY